MARGGALIGALRVTLGLDSAEFEAGSKRAKATAKRDASEIQKAYTAAGLGMKNALSAAAAAVAGVGLLSAAREALDYAASLGEVASQVGVTVEQLQEYRYMATQVGVSQEEMEKSLAKLTLAIGKAAEGSKKEAGTFRELGVAVRDSNGNIISAGDVMPRLADALAKLKDPAQRARLEVELFGKMGQRLDPLLSQGSGAIEDMRKRANDLGIVLSKDLASGADEAADKLAEMEMVLSSNFSRLVAENSDAILGLANAVARLTAEGAAFIAQNPQLTGALLGAAAGARGGAPGAAIGAGLGALAGGKIAQGAADSNMNIKFRAQQARNAVAEYRAIRDANKSGTIFRVRKGTGANSGMTVQSAMAEMERQQGLLRLARDQAAIKPVAAIVPGELPSTSGSSGKGGGGGRGGSGAKSRDRTAEYLERYDRELEGLLQDDLDLRAKMATDTRERAMYENQRINAEKDAYEQDVKRRRLAGELTDGQAKELVSQRSAIADREKALLYRQLDDELAREELDIKREGMSIEQQLLRSAAVNARTADERRRIELAILSNQYEAERLSLENIVASRTATDAQKKLAQLRLDELGRLESADRQNVMRGTLGPLAEYLDRMPQSAQELNEAYQRVAAEGLSSLTDGLADAMTGARSLGDVFKNVANQIIADLLRIQIQKTLTNALSSVIGSIGGGPSLSALLSKGNGITSADAIALPGFAKGGSFMAGGAPGIDRNVLSIGGIPRARVSANERITVTPANTRGNIAQIVPSPYFDVVVDGRVVNTAAPMVGNGIRQNNQAQAFRQTRRIG